MFNRKILVAASAVVLLAALSGCVSYDGASGKRLPQLDYQNIAPLTVSVGRIDVVNNFRPTVENSKAAAAFTTRPEDALNRYAVNRLKAQGYEGTLRFTIDNAVVRHSVVDSDNSVMKWAEVGKQDRYDLTISVGLAKIEADGRQSSSAAIDLNRFITVPQSFSIAKREATLREFMQKLVGEVDVMVTTALQDRLHLAVDAAAPAVNNAPLPGNDGPSVPSLPVSNVKPEPLPPPW